MVRPEVVVTPPLPITTEDGGSIEIRLREGVTAAELLSGALRVVVNNGTNYYETVWETTGNDIGLGLHTQSGSATIGIVSNFDGRKKVLQLGQTRSGYTIVDILVTSSMPEVVMYPSVLDENVENAIMLFREPMPKQAIVDGALEMYCESERWGNQYIYPDVSEQGYMAIMAGGSAYFASEFVQTYNKNLIIYKSGGWTGSDTRFTLPNRLAWMEGYTLLSTMNVGTSGDLPEDVTIPLMDVENEQETATASLSQSEGKIIRTFNTDQSEFPVELRFSGELSPQTIFSSYPKPENVFAIPLRLELFEDEFIVLTPLYAMRKNNYVNNSDTDRMLKTADGSEYATVGTPSPVQIQVI